MAAFVRKEEAHLSKSVSMEENLITVLDENGWNQLVEALERPAREVPAIAELLRHKAPWDQLLVGTVLPPRSMQQGDVSRAASFDCENQVLTDWLKRYAWLSHSSRSACVYVCLDQSGTEVAAYYSLSSGVALTEEAPGRVGQGMPKQVPVQLIGRLGVDRRFKGQGIGRFLILDAFKNVLDISKKTGVRAVKVESKPDAIDFYKKLQFLQSDSNPNLFFFMVRDIARTLAGQ